MSNITVTYDPPEPSDGVVTITMPASMAQKLRALLGQCTGNHFDRLYDVFNDTLPAKGRLSLRLGEAPRSTATGAPIIALHPASGAAFTPSPV